MDEYQRASEAAKRLAATLDRDTEAAMLLEAGSKVIEQQQNRIVELMLERSQALHEIADCSERVLKMQNDAANVVHALDCSTQLIEALLAWLPEGLALSPDVASAKGAWTTAMQKVMR